MWCRGDKGGGGGAWENKAAVTGGGGPVASRLAPAVTPGEES